MPLRKDFDTERADDKIEVLLPAGGRLPPELAAEIQTAGGLEPGEDIKALIRLHGQTLLGRTLTVLRATGRVSRCVVIGGEALHRHPDAQRADALVPQGQTMLENILRGLERLQKDGGTRRHILIVATDQPYLAPEPITRFLDACPPTADICLPIFRAEAFQARFPGSENEYVRLADGRWTMGGVFRLEVDALLRNREHLERITAARKSQMAMVRLFGVGFILKFLTRRLTVPDLEQRCAEILRCRGMAVRDCAPELAYDIDTAAEWRYAREHPANG